jgi:hypothetical protein
MRQIHFLGHGWKQRKTAAATLLYHGSSCQLNHLKKRTDPFFADCFSSISDNLLEKDRSTTAILPYMFMFRIDKKNGYIACLTEPRYVLGVNGVEGKVIEVIMKRRNPDDIFQRWLFISCNGTAQHDENLDLSQSLCVNRYCRLFRAVFRLFSSRILVSSCLKFSQEWH